MSVDLLPACGGWFIASLRRMVYCQPAADGLLPACGGWFIACLRRMDHCHASVG
jgi:hypothetical protein